MPSDDAEIIQLMKEEKRSQGQYGVVKGMDGDKKKAADSISIQTDTGRDSQRVYGDYDNQSRKVKSELAQSIVEKDERLLRYIQGDPLAATVSQDDWGNLATFTDTAKNLIGRVNNPVLSVFKDMRQLHDAIYPGDASYFMRGFVTGITKENPELAAEFVEGMGYHMPEAMRPTMFTGAKAIRDFAATIKPEGYETKTGDILDGKSWSDLAPALAEKFGGAVASMVPGVIAGGAGALAGAATPIPGGAIAGGLVGAGSVSYAMGYGEVFKALKDEGVDPAFAANVSAGAAVLIGGLDLASFGSIAGKIIAPTAMKELSKYVAVRIAKEFAKGATKEGLTESMQEIVKDAAVSWAADKKFGTPEQMKGWLESGIVGGMTGGLVQGATGLRQVPRPPLDKDLEDLKKGADKVARTIDNTEPWVMNGEKPPVGVDPVADHFIGLDSKEQMDVLDAVMQTRDKTETKELSIEKWNDLTKITFEKAEIEVRWDAVKAIYGDKLPEPDDKLLGNIPNIVDKFTNSAVTGESVKIKLSDWVGLVDSEIHKILHDDLAFPDGMTMSEANAQPTLDQVTKYSTIPETEVPGLPQELDKPYSLKKGKEGVYEVFDEAGSLATRVRVVENENGKNLHVHFRTGQIDIAGLRTLMKQLKEEYPEAETLTSPKMPGVEALKRALQGSTISIGMPFRIKESTVDLVRKSAGLEPLFDLPRDGPRTITLTKNQGQGLFPGDVNFTITDELGREVAVVEGARRQKGKDYYIDWIGMPVGAEEGERGLANKLGPKLVRNLFRQFKEHLPGLKTITGMRATGGREKSGHREVVQIDISRLMEEQERAPAGWEGAEPGPDMPETQKLVDLTQGYTKFGPELWAQRSREWTPQELEIERKITRLMDKIAPKEVQVLGAEDIRKGKEQRRVHGVLQMYYHRRPLILWALSSTDPSLAHDPVGTARHEAIHFLRQYGYINEKEWEALTKHIFDNNLIEHHGIDSRYPGASEELRIEEAIAEEFRVWSRQAEPTTAMGKVFGRIKEILDNIKSAYREYMGREPTVDDIFRDIDIGRVGGRTPGPSVEPRLHRALEQRPDLAGPEGLEQRPPEAPVDDNAFRNAGFTESEIRHGLSESQKAKVRDGYIYWGGELQPATPEMLEMFKKGAAEDAVKKAEDTKKMNAAFAQKPAYPPLGHILGSDWGMGRGMGNDPASWRRGAYAQLDLKYSHNQAMVSKVEQALARRPAAYDPGGPVEGEVPMIPGLMDKARYAKYMKGINERNFEDAEWEKEKAEREIKRKNAPEWKNREVEMKAEVTKEISNRPDWKVSQFFRNGMFFGNETNYRPKIDPKYLTPEQVAGLPDQFVKKGGMDPDQLAGSFGYTTGKIMVDRMVEFERVKGKLGPKEFFDEMVKQETNRRMDLKYGKKADENLKEAMDHVIGTTQMDLLHEETLALATRAGQSFPLTKEDLRANAATRFNNEIAAEVSMRGYFREMYRAGKAAEMAFLNDDWVTAFQQKQQQVHLFALAEHAKKFEKTEAQLDRISKQFNKRDIDTKYMPPEFTEWIHHILFQIGRPPKRLPDDLKMMIQTREHHNLADFVHDKNNFPEGYMEYEDEINPKLIVADFLQEVDENGDPVWKKNFESLTVGEFRAINMSLQSLKAIGRMEGKSNLAGEIKDTNEVLAQIDKQLSKRGEKKQPPPGQKKGILTIGHLGLLQPEALWDRLDEGNQRGLFSRLFGISLANAANEYSAMQRRFAKKLTEIDKKYGLSWTDMHRKVDNDVFYEPVFMVKDKDGKPVIPAKADQWIPMTREHVRGVILNWGNFGKNGNRQRLLEGFNVKEADVEAWLKKVSTPEDWLWAQEVGRLYKDIQNDSDEMTFRMTGTIIEKIPLPKFINPLGIETEGYYYPVIYDRTRDGGARLSAEKAPPIKSLTYNGFERKRTGSAGPLDLSLGQLEGFISRRLKDNAMREPLEEVYKIWSHKTFRASMAKYYGAHYNELLDNLYKDLTGQTGYASGTMGAGMRFAEGVRQNTISVLVGYNPGTVLKHGTSAMVQSWKEAGILKTDFYKAVVDLLRSNEATMDRNWTWIDKGGKIGDLDWGGSPEIQRRHQHWAETIGGAGDIKMGRKNWRESMQFYGSWPVAFSDLISSKILWKARYDRVMRENVLNMPIEEAHTIAVEMAEKAVRRTHGSTAITSRPAFMRSQNPFATNLTSLYGFFNHVYNRFYKMAWQSKDLYQGTVRGEVSPKEFAKQASDLAGDFTMYIAVPSFIEGMVVEGLMTADWDDMGWGELFAHSMLHTVSASIPLVRDVVHAVSTGHDPAAGLLGATYKGVSDAYRQVTKEDMDVGKSIQAMNVLLGIFSGLSSAQLGRWQRFAYNYVTGQEEPTDLEEWYRAFRTGTTVPRRH